MESAKKKRLEQAGWKVGTVRELLGLSDAESDYIEIKLRLASALTARRTRKRFTQVDVARLLKSSQSRVAKMEAGDTSVSLDLLVRSLLALGATPRDVASALTTGKTSRTSV